MGPSADEPKRVPRLAAKALPARQTPPDIQRVADRETTATATDHRCPTDVPPAGAAMRIRDVVFFA
jgi:hypothetical protein